MSDERKPEEREPERREEEVEDLDVPESESEDVKGGRPTYAATGKHIQKAQLNL